MLKFGIQNSYTTCQIVKVDSILLFIKLIFQWLVLTDIDHTALRFNSKFSKRYYKLFAINVKKLFQGHSGKIYDHKVAS